MLSSRPLNFAVLGLCATLLAAGCDRQSEKQAQPQGTQTVGAASSTAAGEDAGTLTGTIDRSHKGQPFPTFTAKDPAGRSLALQDLKGPVLVNLWATWCAPCVTELPQLDKLTGTLKVVTVSQDLGEPAKVAEFLKAQGLTHLEPWLDPENELAFKYGGGTLPTTVYYDAAGREVWRMVGGHDWANAETAKLLAEAR